MSKNQAAKASVPAGAIVKPKGGNLGVNLSAQFPLYNGGDARTAAVGTKGAPIHGRLQGIIDLPGVLKDEHGNKKPWSAFVIRLMQPCPVSDAGSEEIRMAQSGEQIALTRTKVLEDQRFTAAALRDDGKIFEVWIEPVVDKTKDGQSLWKYPTFELVNALVREPADNVAVPGFVAPQFSGAAPKQLGANGTAETYPAGL